MALEVVGLARASRASRTATAPSENQVSSTSSSCRSGWSPACLRASSSVSATKTRAVLGVPGRNAVAPPQLARDAPGLDVLEPVEPGLLPGLGHDPDVAVLHRLERGRARAWPRRRTIGRSATARSPRPSGRRTASGSRGPRPGPARLRPRAARRTALRASSRVEAEQVARASRPSCVWTTMRRAHRTC